MSELRSTVSAYDASYPPSLYPPGPTPPGPSTVTITGLVPATAVAGAVPLVQINGTGFSGAAVVRIDGIGAQTTFVSPTQLTTTSMTGKPVGAHNVTVGKPGEEWSAPAVFTVTGAEVQAEQEPPPEATPET